MVVYVRKFVSVLNQTTFSLHFKKGIVMAFFLLFAGRPTPGKELTNEFNVLEAGLWNSVSLTKGCYKGQETISRLITYDGVKQRLWGIRLSAPVEPGSAIMVDGKKVGEQSHDPMLLTG
ncbi:putative transferase At1g60990, chloroplastic [Pistacia vera]|uniref:putative transferase At1g60990, chloroplastic n=1 Tax=Pistacia vera TaxID=55513 RepID=UPI001262C111|nr:putative transferase At1g60990, chloroplastic [Pistacia vera]